MQFGLEKGEALAMRSWETRELSLLWDRVTLRGKKKFKSDW